jgi:hypothetical protein
MMSVFQWAAVAFGAVGAVLWLLAAFVKTPEKLSSFLESTIDGSQGVFAELRELAEGVKKQSRLNAGAATVTALSVICQAIAILITPAG